MGALGSRVSVDVYESGLDLRQTEAPWAGTLRVSHECGHPLKVGVGGWRRGEVPAASLMPGGRRGSEMGSSLNTGRGGAGLGVDAAAQRLMCKVQPRRPRQPRSLSMWLPGKDPWHGRGWPGAREQHPRSG